MKGLHRERKVKIRERKQAYKNKLEQKLQHDGAEQVWDGVRKITVLE